MGMVCTKGIGRRWGDGTPVVLAGWLLAFPAEFRCPQLRSTLPTVWTVGKSLSIFDPYCQSLYFCVHSVLVFPCCVHIVLGALCCRSVCVPLCECAVSRVVIVRLLASIVLYASLFPWVCCSIGVYASLMCCFLGVGLFASCICALSMWFPAVPALFPSYFQYFC